MERWWQPHWSAEYKDNGDDDYMEKQQDVKEEDHHDCHLHVEHLQVRQPKTGRIIPMVQPGMGTSLQSGEIIFIFCCSCFMTLTDTPG